MKKLLTEYQSTALGHTGFGKHAARENHSLDNCALSDWDIIPEDIYDCAGVKINGYSIFKDSKDGAVIGKPVPETYKPVNNKAFIELVRSVIDSTEGATLESAGTCRSRARTYLSVNIAGASLFSAGGRDFQDFLNFGNSFDGSCGVWCCNSNICTVCENTFYYNMIEEKLSAGDKNNLYIRHSGDIEFKLKKAHEIVEKWLVSKQLFAKRFDEMARIDISKQTANSVYKGFFANDKGELSARGAKKANRLLELFENGRGNSGNTMADLFSGFTEFYTHENRKIQSESDYEKAKNSSEHGSAGEQKRKFWDSIIIPASFESLIAKGENCKLAA